MLTLFSIPKPFGGHIAVIQRNAIQSWLQFGPECEIILFGDEEGTADIAAKLDVRHVPHVERNECGTPLVHDLFAKAQTMATNDLLCYINADIILMSDFVAAVRHIPFRRFLMVGQRWDVHVDQSWDFSAPNWEIRMREHVCNQGTLHAPTGIDYFVFPRGLFRDVPPFAIGRTVWDNWLIYAARRRGTAVIDVTQTVMAVHQNHDWSHIPGGKVGAWEGPEARHNLEIADGYTHVFTLQDATHVLTAKGPKLDLTRRRLQRHLDTLPIVFPYLRPVVMLVMALIRISRPLRLRLGLMTNSTSCEKR